MNDWLTNAEKAREFVDNTPARAHTGFRLAKDPLLGGERLMERVIMDLDTGEFSVQVLSGPDSGSVRKYCVREGTREERWTYFLDQFA